MKYVFTIMLGIVIIALITIITPQPYGMLVSGITGVLMAVLLIYMNEKEQKRL